MNDASVDGNDAFRVWRRYPPKVVWPYPDIPVVWVVVDVTLPCYLNPDDDYGFHEEIIGVYSTYRKAVRGLINAFMERYGKPLEYMHKLTWETVPNPGYITCWDDDNWQMPGGLRFLIQAFEIDGPTPWSSFVEYAMNRITSKETEETKT